MIFLIMDSFYGIEESLYNCQISEDKIASISLTLILLLYFLSILLEGKCLDYFSPQCFVPILTKVVSFLNQQDCFILSSGGPNGIFAWIGKEATKEERAQAMTSAQAFLEQQGLPKWMKVY